MFKISRKFRHINESKQFYFWFSSICGGSDIDSPDWIRKKLAAINSKIEDDKCIQYATTVALNYKEIKWNPERVSDIKLLLNKYDLEKINYPSKVGDWKRFEKNNPSIALNILCVPKKNKYFQLISKIIFPAMRNIILWMIPNEEKEGWHYLAVKEFFTLLRGIISKHHGDFYCLNCIHSFKT